MEVAFGRNDGDRSVNLTGVSVAIKSCIVFDAKHGGTVRSDQLFWNAARLVVDSGTNPSHVRNGGQVAVPGIVVVGEGNRLPVGSHDPSDGLQVVWIVVVKN